MEREFPVDLSPQILPVAKRWGGGPPERRWWGTAGTAVVGSRAQRGMRLKLKAIAGYAGDPLPHFVGTPPSAMGKILPRTRSCP